MVRSSMSKVRIEVDGGKTFGPYSPGVKSNGMIWLAGQIAPEAGDDIKLQTQDVFLKHSKNHLIVFPKYLEPY